MVNQNGRPTEMENWLKDHPEAANWLDAHLKDIKEKIIAEAQQIAEEDKRSTAVRNIPIAANRFAPGEYCQAIPRVRWYQHTMFASITGVTIISAILALAFGGIGFAVATSSAGSSEVSALTSGFVDIAQVFAGAIVGSSVATAAAQGRNG